MPSPANFLYRGYRKLAGLGMLYPDPGYSHGELPRILERSIRRGVTVINLVLHSSELALYCSPITKTLQDLDSVWRHLEEAFRYARDCGIASEGISDVALLARQNAKRD